MEEQKTELKMIRMSEIESQEVKWLWYPFIPYGKLTIIQGDPGDGKTTLVLNIAAKLSKGESLGSDIDVHEPVNVIYQTAEDGLADTVKPRLELAGADCEKILVIDESDGGGGVVQQHGAYRVGCVEHSSVGVHVDDHAGGVQRRRLFQASGDLPDRRGHDVFAYGQEIDRRAGIRGGFFPGGYLRPADRYSRGKEQEVEQYCRTELVHGRMVLDGCPHRRTFRLQI